MSTLRVGPHGPAAITKFGEEMPLSEVEVTPLEFDSADGASRISACVWARRSFTSDGFPAPRGVVQIVHGMCEHKERYGAFARDLAARGFVVCAHDQIGHGASAPKDRWGKLPAEGGRDVLVQDVHTLRGIMQDGPDGSSPYFIFGHSMGSFVARAYISQYGSGLAGAILCGTGTVAPATSRAGNALARAIAGLRGEDHVSNLLHNMADGSYAKAMSNPRTEFDWLSRNQANVDAYIADEACGFPFSAGGYATLTSLTAEVCTLECAQRVPASLPLLYIAGAEDPVGSNGAGVEAAASLARQAGSTDVTTINYPRMRHEILNENGREQVYLDIVSWMAERGPAWQAARTTA